MWLQLCFNLSVNETQVGTHLTIAENYIMRSPFKPSDAAQFIQYTGVSHFFVSAQPFKRISLSSLFHFPVFFPSYNSNSEFLWLYYIQRVYITCKHAVSHRKKRNPFIHVVLRCVTGITISQLVRMCGIYASKI